MAEGDTVLRAARRIDEALSGERIEVSVPGPRGRTAGLQRLDGRTLERVEARGKNLLLDFGELALHSHLGMNGSWRVYRRDARWRKAPGAAWALLRGERWEAVQFGGPTLRVLPAARLRRELTARLGPDILAPDLDVAATVATLRAPPIASSATPCSTRASSPESATSSRARPASLPISIPGATSTSSPMASWSGSSRPRAS